MSKECMRYIPASRQVIENKLLARLDERGTVAILANEQDLRLMVQALESMGAFNSKANEMASDLRKLLHAAFP